MLPLILDPSVRVIIATSRQQGWGSSIPRSDCDDRHRLQEVGNVLGVDNAIVQGCLCPPLQPANGERAAFQTVSKSATSRSGSTPQASERPRPTSLRQLMEALGT